MACSSYNPAPRIAFFTDSFHETNGVALTSREFERYASRHGLPFLSIHAGERTLWRSEGAGETVELRRSSLSLPLDRGLSFDPLLPRYLNQVTRRTRRFRPDFIHFTGPGDFGVLAMLAAARLRTPLIGSGHTNLHEFAAQRLENLLGFLPAPIPRAVSLPAESAALAICLASYRSATVCWAPNPELIEMVRRGTNRQTFPMPRGVDTSLFDPGKRPAGERPFTIGFTGRLQAEKNVRFLAEIEDALMTGPVDDFRFLIVGDGDERAWLQRRMRRAALPGTLTGELLARAYAEMDVFVFPSRTDTFGNVVLEAMASGVPVIVTGSGGPKYLVGSGENGFVAATEAAFIDCVRLLMREGELRTRLAEGARAFALTQSWDATFERVYQAYREASAARTASSASGLTRAPGRERRQSPQLR